MQLGVDSFAAAALGDGAANSVSALDLVRQLIERIQHVE